MLCETLGGEFFQRLVYCSRVFSGAGDQDVDVLSGAVERGWAWSETAGFADKSSRSADDL